jgi:hypothetical protein
LLDALDEEFSDSEIFCSQLLRKKRGLPLYDLAPQINLPAAYQRNGVGIGDVGRVTPEGIFDFFFNIFLPPEHSINGNNTPEDFSPMAPYTAIDVFNQNFRPGSYVSTSTVQNLDLNGPSGYAMCIAVRTRLLTIRSRVVNFREAILFSSVIVCKAPFSRSRMGAISRNS